MSFAYLEVIVIQVLLPVLLIFTLWRTKAENRLDWVVQSLFTAVFLLWIFLTGDWEWISYYMEYFWLLLFVPAFYRSWKKTKKLPFRTKIRLDQMLARWTYILLLFVFIAHMLFFYIL